MIHAPWVEVNGTSFAVLAGGVIAGVLEALLAVPIAAAVKLILDRWPLYPD